MLLSFPDGKVIDNLRIAGTVAPTSDPHYLVHFTPGAKTADLFELDTHKVIARVAKGGTDMYGGEIASFSVGEGLVLVRAVMGEKPMLAKIEAGPLPRLYTAIASPGLDALIISADGQGAAYRVADGTQIANFTGLRGAWFDDDQHATLRVPEEEPLHSQLQTFSGTNGATDVAWSRVDERLHNESLMSGPVLLTEVRQQVGFYIGQKTLGFNERALDLKTGKMLWSRDFGGNPPREGYSGEPPVAFTDPQGERVVLGWDAKSDHAGDLAKRNAVAKQNMKAKKVNEHDSLFEVANARTGATEGVAFVPGGSGPQGYSSAYSAGNWLILVKDGVRITAVSLVDGDERLHLTGRETALCAAADLLAVSDDGGRLSLYDLVAGARKDAWTLPENVVYLRFSADRKRLLALTEYQTAYVLDLTAAKAGAAPSN